jgi:hypothetical protein
VIDLDALYWRLAGYYYGYPTCCIEAFIRDMQVNVSMRHRAYTNRRLREGYVPCALHAVYPPARLFKPFPVSREVQLVDLQILHRLARDGVRDQLSCQV